MIKIYHPVKERKVEVKDISVKINNTFDEHGKPFAQEYVEFTVVGNQHEYQDFMLVKDFKEHNPTVKLN